MTFVPVADMTRYVIHADGIEFRVSTNGTDIEFESLTSDYPLSNKYLSNFFNPLNVQLIEAGGLAKEVETINGSAPDYFSNNHNFWDVNFVTAEDLVFIQTQLYPTIDSLTYIALFQNKEFIGDLVYTNISLCAKESLISYVDVKRINHLTSLL